jgi:hypothetical protein
VQAASLAPPESPASSDAPPESPASSESLEAGEEGFGAQAPNPATRTATFGANENHTLPSGRPCFFMAHS